MSIAGRLRSLVVEGTRRMVDPAFAAAAAAAGAAGGSRFGGGYPMIRVYRGPRHSIKTRGEGTRTVAKLVSSRGISEESGLPSSVLQQNPRGTPGCATAGAGLDRNILNGEKGQFLRNRKKEVYRSRQRAAKGERRRRREVDRLMKQPPAPTKFPASR